VQAITPRPGVDYAGLWLNEKGLERAMATGRLKIEGRIALCASEKFLKRNNNKSFAEQIAYNHRALDMFKAHGIPVKKGSIMAAFGCNFEGDVEASKVVEQVDQMFTIAAEHEVEIETVSLADTMAWGNPASIRKTVGAIRERYPDLKLNLHLHDTRGMAIANAYAGLEMGVDRFDTAVGGLGGCPFAGHKGAAGNICTEDLVFMCDEMGIETGIDLQRLIECARLAEDIVGHPLPGSVKVGGTLTKLRDTAAHA